MENLEGKVVVITGAARGMGKVYASSFAREGSRVVATDVDEKELNKTIKELKGMGFDVFSHVLDISDNDACVALVEKVESEVGPIGVLVNNAGIAMNEEVMETSESSFRRITEVNYLGHVWMMHAAIPGMLERGSGHVVNVCSILGKVSVPKLGAYSATKHAMVSITDTIRQELHGSGVHFTIVNPGYVATGMFEGAKIPIVTRWQDPQKIVNAVVDAVKKNKVEIFVPNFMNRMTTLVRGLHTKLIDIAFKILGASKSFDTMDKDRGRPF